MSLRHENLGGGNGGGSGSKTTVESSRNTITCTETETGWDINVASEDSLRYIIHNFKEFMEASVDIGTRYARGETTSCVMQLVDDIMMCDATAEDEELYKVGTTKLIDFANKTFKFGWYFFYTTILCDGRRRHLQLLYPDGTHIDTWQFQANRIKFDNVHIGGGIGLYNQKHSTHYDPQTVAYSRYLLASTINLNYEITNCTIACCGANDNSINPFIYEGQSTSHELFQYHTNIKILNCDFFHGGDSHGGMWDNLNAPIVIDSVTIFSPTTSHQRNVTLKQLSKNINSDANETGCPHIQFRTVPFSDPDYDTQKAYWISHPWVVSSDGSCLVTNTVDNACVILGTKLALEDIYLQNPALLPQNYSPDENYVSLVTELLARQGGVDVETVYEQIADNDYIITQPHGGENNEDLERKSMFYLGEWVKKAIFYKGNIGSIDLNTSEDRLILVAECAPNTNQVSCAVGILFGCSATSTSYSVMQKINVVYENGNYSVKSDLIQANGSVRAVVPTIVQYNNKTYIAFRESGYPLNYTFFGKAFKWLDSYIELYHKTDTDTWYTDRGRSVSQVTVTIVEEAGRMPANLDFGGTSDQVVAGDGSMKNWNEKLSYWTGTQQQYDDLQTYDSSTLYIIQ